MGHEQQPKLTAVRVKAGQKAASACCDCCATLSTVRYDTFEMTGTAG